MESRRNRDRLSSLPDHLLVMVISNLPYKTAVMTSTLSKRWENLHRATTNVAFKESDFVKRSVSDDEDEGAIRVAFVRFMANWVSRFSGEAIVRFELCFSNPTGFETVIKSVIEFAVSKQVKNLVLDFSDASLTTSNQAASVFQLPECFSNLAKLESLKLLACRFDPSRLAQQSSLKSLWFGSMQLGKIMAWLSKSPLLESLIIQNCCNVGLEALSDCNNLRTLIFDQCSFATEYSTLDLPNIQIFKYSGKVHYFQFLQVNRVMEEAYLDFGAETEHDDDETGTILSGLLYDLLSARKLTVCPFLIKSIKDSEDPVRLPAPMETKHLVIKTNLIPDQFIGIRLMINSSPFLETLTFQMLPPPIPQPTTNPGFNPNAYWSYELSHECLKKTLKVVELRNITCGTYELHILRYLIQWGLVLERVDLYLPWGTQEEYKNNVCTRVTKLMGACEAASGRLCIRLHEVQKPSCIAD